MPAAPRRFLLRALLAAVLGLTAAFAVACGSSGSGKGLLSAAESRTIVSALNGISSAVRQHSCARTRTSLQALDNALRNLSPSTSSALVNRLAHGATRVSTLAQGQCAKPQKTTTTSSTTASTTSSTTSSTPTPTTTQSQSVSTTQSVPTTSSNPQSTPGTTPSTPTNPGPGNGNGNGKGGGGGGAGLGGGSSH